MSTRARDILVVGGDVVVIWEDGHESYFPAAELRKACSCASCSGEGHLFGRRTLPTMTRLRPEAFTAVAVHRVGNYGLQVAWGDGHDHGIYHLDALRAACPCEACRKAAAETR